MAVLPKRVKRSVGTTITRITTTTITTTTTTTMRNDTYYTNNTFCEFLMMNNNTITNYSIPSNCSMFQRTIEEDRNLAKLGIIALSAVAFMIPIVCLNHVRNMYCNTWMRRGSDIFEQLGKIDDHINLRLQFPNRLKKCLWWKVH